MSFTILSVVMIAIFATVAIFLLIIGFRRDQFKKKGVSKVFAAMFGFIFLILAFITLGMAVDVVPIPDSASGVFLAIGETPDGEIVIVTGTAGTGPSVTTFQPTAAYSAVDKFSATTSISGTQYYQLDGAKFTTTAQTNVNEGQSISYWVDNATYYVQPAFIPRASGSVNSVDVEGYNNGTATITLYDQIARQAVTGGTNNISLGANKQANVEISYQGTAKKSAGPFGGVLVVEYNSTIPSVICTGPQLLNTNPYHITYTVGNLANTFQTWAYAPEMDDGSGGVRKIDCQFLNGASAAGVGARYEVTFIPADYYITDAGDIALDTEKFLNQDTTRTAGNFPTTFGGWAA